MQYLRETVVIRKMRSAGLYSTARYSLYFEQYIDGYIIYIILSNLFSETKGCAKETSVSRDVLLLFLYLFV